MLAVGGGGTMIFQDGSVQSTAAQSFVPPVAIEYSTGIFAYGGTNILSTGSSGEIAITAPGYGGSIPALIVYQQLLGSGAGIQIETNFDSTGPMIIAQGFTVDNSGNILLSSPATGITFPDSTVQTTAATGFSPPVSISAGTTVLRSTNGSIGFDSYGQPNFLGYLGTVGISFNGQDGGVLVTGPLDVTGAATFGGALTLSAPLSPSYGGTGVANNAGSTITISGASSTTFTLTGVTNVTLPTSGTLLTTTGSAASLTSFPTFNQNTTGTAANITGTSNATLTTLSGLTTAASLATVGTIGTGTWHGTVVGATYGGTGVANPGTWTNAANVSFAGAYTSALTLTGATTVTLPTSGTLATTGSNSFGATTFTGAVSLGSQTISTSGNSTMSGTLTLGTVGTGTWNGSLIGPAYGGTGVANNAASTITISGSSAVTLTLTGSTNVTLPTSGTLVALGGNNTFSGNTTFSNAISVSTGTSNFYGQLSVGSQCAAGYFAIGAAPSTTAGSTSGTLLYARWFQAGYGSMWLVSLEALNGSASFSFGQNFNNTPATMGNATAIAAATVSTTGCTVSTLTATSGQFMIFGN